MKNLCRILIFSVLLFLVLDALAAQDRGLSVVAGEALGKGVTIGKQWAVFIAIDRYREWGPLSNPVRDAKEIRDILNEQYFIDEIVELYDQDATAAKIRGLFGDLRQKVRNNDSVFVFYAGHGQTDIITNSGSWIPVDAGRDQLAQTNWLPNIQVRNMLSALPAKHVFLISDACFSGDILDTNRGASPQINSDYYRYAYSLVSRQVMTSGASESVPDSSEFALRLKSALRRAEGLCIDPEYIFTSVREVRATQPLLGTITGSEHQAGGSFLFFRRSDQTMGTAVTPVPLQPQRQPPVADSPSVGNAAGSDFSTGRKVGAMTLNLALGLGSFTMGDVGGGFTILAGYAIAGGLIGIELGALEYEDSLAGVLGPIGVSVAGITAVYGFIRPFFYHKSTRTTFTDVLDRMNISITPDTTGIKAISLSYTYHY